MEVFTLLLETLLFLFAVYVVQLLYTRRKIFVIFEELGIPGPKPHFFRGNNSDVRPGSIKPVVTMEKWFRTYGKVYGYFRGKQPNLVVGDLDLVKQILVKDFANFTNRWQPPISISKSSVLNLEGQRWKEVRKVITPTFSASKLRSICFIMNRAIDTFGVELDKLAEKKADFDIYDRFQRLTLDVISESALAIKAKCQQEENDRFYTSVRDMMRVGGSNLGLFITLFPEIARSIPFILRLLPTFKMSKYVKDNLKNIIKLRKSKNTSEKALDILQLMLEAADEEKSADMEPLTDEEIADNCWVFILAGFETTATALSYVSYLLSIHQDVQDKVYEEIIEQIKDISNPTYEDTNCLPYMSQVIKETLRLYPPVVLLVNRVAANNYELDGMTIPAGMKVEIPIYSIHHDPEHWPEPEKFDPDRFSPENTVNIHPMAHLPFGTGPRNCIGLRFGLLEIKLSLIKLLTKYRLFLSSNQKIPLETFVPHVTHVPKNGVYVRLEPRKQMVEN